ncbi:hypothetical protein MNBD_GAMMA04-2233 [hydrothermal vent metagenome]|uniref:Uncharacterized protein n=1 Tax=hydrothermal vent metagenome TaxID=652676 RepID=A0A3B0VXX6_9ZZZZ
MLVTAFIACGGGSFTAAANGLLVSTNVNGSVGYIYRASAYGSGTYNNQNLLKTNIDNTFFIWRDWFITGSSSLVLTQDQTVTEGRSSNTFSSTGQLGFSVLPQSSTPFGFSYTRSDSKVESDLKLFTGANAASLDDTVVSDSWVMHQSLVGKGYRLRLRYSEDQFNSSLRGRYGSSNIGLSGVFRSKSGVLKTTVTQNDGTTYNKVDRKSLITRVSHNYTGFPQTAISTVLSSNNTQQSLLASGSSGNMADYDVTLNQASVTLIWRSLNKKLTVTNGFRFLGIDSVVSSSLGKVSNSSLAANLGLAYRFTQNLTANVNSSRVINESSGGDSTVEQDRVGLQYRSNGIELGDYDYDWRASTDLSLREDDGRKSNSASFSLGHGLGRRWDFARTQRVYLRGSQDYSISSQVNRERQRLGHRVSLGWKQSLAGISRRMQVQISDQRDIGSDTVLQTISADVDQQMQMTRRIKLNGSLNYQLTNYQYAGSSGEVSSSDTSVVSMDGGLSYMNPFSVAGLMFTSSYRYTQSVVALESDLTVQQTLDNKLNYRVGKIDVSLQYLYREARKISYNSVYFRVRRVF